MVHAQRDGLRRLQESPRPFGEFFEVHTGPCLLSGEDVGVAFMQRKGGPSMAIDECARRVCELERSTLPAHVPAKALGGLNNAEAVRECVIFHAIMFLASVRSQRRRWRAPHEEQVVAAAPARHPMMRPEIP